MLVIMSDEDFAIAFERCEIPKEEFHHRDHVRLAKFYLEQYGAQAADARMAQAVRNFADHHQVSGKYHHTMTIAWMRLVAHDPDSALLLDAKYLREFYSDAVLQSDASRNTFVTPDKRPLPGDARSTPGVVK